MRCRINTNPVENGTNCVLGTAWLRTKTSLFSPARLDEVKGIAILVRAFRMLLERYPNSRLIIAGEGDYQMLFSQAFKDWSKVTFTGYIDQKTLYDFYSIADMGVVPSLHE